MPIVDPVVLVAQNLLPGNKLVEALDLVDVPEVVLVFVVVVAVEHLLLQHWRREVIQHLVAAVVVQAAQAGLNLVKGKHFIPQQDEIFLVYHLHVMQHVILQLLARDRTNSLVLILLVNLVEEQEDDLLPDPFNLHKVLELAVGRPLHQRLLVDCNSITSVVKLVLILAQQQSASSLVLDFLLAQLLCDAAGVLHLFDSPPVVAIFFFVGGLEQLLLERCLIQLVEALNQIFRLDFLDFLLLMILALDRLGLAGEFIAHSVELFLVHDFVNEPVSALSMLLFLDDGDTVVEEVIVVFYLLQFYFFCNWNLDQFLFFGEVVVLAVSLGLVVRTLSLLLGELFFQLFDDWLDVLYDQVGFHLLLGLSPFLRLRREGCEL